VDNHMDFNRRRLLTPCGLAALRGLKFNTLGYGGFWEIQTSSLIDFPQEARILEIFDNGDGTGAIRTFVFNQQAGGQLGKNAKASFLSAMEEGLDGIGKKQDRSVDLIFKMPGVD